MPRHEKALDAANGDVPTPEPDRPTASDLLNNDDIEWTLATEGGLRGGAIDKVMAVLEKLRKPSAYPDVARTVKKGRKQWEPILIAALRHESANVRQQVPRVFVVNAWRNQPITQALADAFEQEQNEKLLKSWAFDALIYLKQPTDRGATIKTNLRVSLLSTLERVRSPEAFWALADTLCRLSYPPALPVIRQKVSSTGNASLKARLLMTLKRCPAKTPRSAPAPKPATSSRKSRKAESKRGSSRRKSRDDGFGRIHGLGKIETGGGTGLRGKGRKAKVGGKVRIGSGIAAGTCRKVDVSKVVRRRAGSLNACYMQRLVGNPDLRGKVTVRWSIAKTGKVAKASIAGSTLGDSAAHSCILRLARRMVFPKSDGTCVVQWPFVFTPRR